MSLFVHHDGHMRGWLAALLCCWAAMGDDETFQEREKEKETTKASVPQPVLCTEQPTPLQPMSLNATRALPQSKNASFTEDDRVRPISERPPSLKPLDLGEMSLMGRVALHSRRKSATTLFWSPKRISVGPPKDFTTLDMTEKQRRSLKPLHLEPVVLKGHEGYLPSEGVKLAQSSMPTSNSATDGPSRHSYREARDTPWQRCQQMSATARKDSSQDEAVKKQASVKPPRSTRSSSSSIRSLHRVAIETSASGTASLPSCTSGERMRLHRKRSNQSNRMSTSDSKDLDQEILELNTIVEERRAESGRGQSPEDLHVPAVAPRMGLRTRSETLTDIGSAFSKPLRLETNCQTCQEAVSPFKSPARSRLSRPFTNMPDANLAMQEAGIVRRPSSRVTGWLSNILSTSTASTASADTAPQSLHSVVRLRAASQSSICSTVTELESPCLTATSSPVSKGHSRDRSLVSPPSTACTSEFDTRSTRKKSPGQRLPVEHTSQVGLAL